jgi:hypothetical protein
MATKIGRTIARLLNYGFPIGSATNLIQETMFSGGHYAVVGDSNTTLAQTTGGIPEVHRIFQTENNQFEICIEIFASWNHGTGSMFTTNIERSGCRYIAPGEFGPWKANKSMLAEHLNQGLFPIIVDGKFYWSDTITFSELTSVL